LVLAKPATNETDHDALLNELADRGVPASKTRVEFGGNFVVFPAFLSWADVEAPWSDGSGLQDAGTGGLQVPGQLVAAGAFSALPAGTYALASKSALKLAVGDV